MPSEQDIQRIFRSLPGRFLVLRPDAVFTIVCASADYLRSTCNHTSIGGGLLQLLRNSDAAADGVSSLQASLRRVLATGQPDDMRLQRYEVRLPSPDDDRFETHDWSVRNMPLLAEDGTVEFIVHHVEEAAEQNERNAELEQLVAESERQRRIYETALNATPDFIYVFDLEHRALYANEALLRTWGVADVRGKRWMDLGYEQWHADMHDRELDQVIATRAPIRGEIPFTGTGGTRVYDYIFAPVLGENGEVVAVAGTTRDVTDRQAVEQAVREQAERLAQADLAKDEFLATLSHELRNPLVPLRNGIELLSRYGNSDERSLRVGAMMERQIGQLVRLVEDLLEMSRISRGTLSLQMERVELASVVRHAVETSEGLIEAAGHTLIVELPVEPVWIDGDPVRLTQILANLLNNAAKFTDHGGRIELRGEVEGGQAVISVSDNGSGIEPEMQQRVFEMFNRGKRSHRESKRNQAGLGIGLALSRKLAEMHGGQLVVESAGANMGSRFSFSLPLASGAPTLVAGEDGHNASLRGLKVLVIEDNREVAASLQMLLETLDAEVHLAHDGPEGLAAYAALRPAAVLLDIGMPGMNGYEVARAIRRRFPEQPALLVALTGWGRDEDRRRAAEAGFDHHIVKPADLSVLERLLGTARNDGARSVVSARKPG